MAALDERPRLPRQLLLEREVERLLVAGDVQDVAEALGGDHPDLGAGVGEDDVRGDGRAVQEVVDLRQRDAGLRAQPVHAFDHAARRVVRRRRDLVDGDPPASSSTRIRSVNVPPTSTPMRFIPAPPPSTLLAELCGSPLYFAR